MDNMESVIRSKITGVLDKLYVPHPGLPDRLQPG